MSRNEIISIAIGILLTGSGVLLRKSYAWGYVLIAIASICFLYVAIVEVVLRIPKLYVMPGKAGNAAQRIYVSALKKGGTILATHIFPTQENIEKDFAVEILKKVEDKTIIDFKRVVIFENPLEEKRFVENLFKELPDHINITLHVLSRYPLGMTRIAKSGIPRFNLLLHQKEKSYKSLLGLDDLETRGAKTDFAVEFKGRKAYSSLKSYFAGLTASPELVAIQNIQQYEGYRALETIPLKSHETITGLIKYAEQDLRIIFAGLFGSIASSVNDVFPEALSNRQDMDVDTLFVCERESEIADIKDSIKGIFSDAQYNIVWGDDDKEFYSFRYQDKINIDIEIFVKGDDFYERNTLLSYSIFRYFLPLYSSVASNISDHLTIQKGPLIEETRWIKLLTDRKGYLDFKKYLSQFNPYIDPRRVLSLTLRNFVWAVSGHYPATAKVCVQYLRSIVEHPLDSQELGMCDTILSASNENLQHNQNRFLTNVASILDTLTGYAVAKLDSNSDVHEEMVNKCIQSTLVPRVPDA